MSSYENPGFHDPIAVKAEKPASTPKGGGKSPWDLDVLSTMSALAVLLMLVLITVLGILNP